MDRRILDMTFTVWHKAAETDRVATWNSTTARCHWEPRRGSYRTASGEETAWQCEIITEYGGIEKGDKVAVGTSESATPPADAFTVVYVDALPLRGMVHHYEVMAQ